MVRRNELSPVAVVDIGSNSVRLVVYVTDMQRHRLGGDYWGHINWLAATSCVLAWHLAMNTIHPSLGSPHGLTR